MPGLVQSLALGGRAQATSSRSRHRRAHPPLRVPQVDAVLDHARDEAVAPESSLAVGVLNGVADDDALVPGRALRPSDKGGGTPSPVTTLNSMRQRPRVQASVGRSAGQDRASLGLLTPRVPEAVIGLAGPGPDCSPMSLPTRL